MDVGDIDYDAFEQTFNVQKFDPDRSIEGQMIFCGGGYAKRVAGVWRWFGPGPPPEGLREIVPIE